MITPMVARLIKHPFDREGWLFELKWDGFRAIASDTKNSMALRTIITRKTKAVEKGFRTRPTQRS
jgi:ATP-dependent DNA ligase